MNKIFFYILMLLCLEKGIAMDRSLLVDLDNDYAKIPQKPYEKHLYEKGAQTAREEATFTFRIIPPDSNFSPFTLHLTSHRLSFDILSPHTQKLINNANTIVIEPIPEEDEPLELRPHLEAIFKEHLIDPESHKKLKSEMTLQDYENLKLYCKKKTPQLFTDDSFAKFEDLNALCFSFFLRKLYISKEMEEGMDIQIERIALEKGIILAGLESFFEKLITLMPESLQVLQKDRGSFLNQDINWYLQNLSDKVPNAIQKPILDNPWDSNCMDGKFFLLSYLCDQENDKADMDSVYSRNTQWIPRIKEIISSPRYLTPISINVGYGHHGLLGLLEQEGFEIMILNKNGEWYPLPYAQSYEAFQKKS